MHLQLLLEAEIVKNKQVNKPKNAEESVLFFFFHAEITTFHHLDGLNQTNGFKNHGKLGSCDSLNPCST